MAGIVPWLWTLLGVFVGFATMILGGEAESPLSVALGSLSLCSPRLS